MRNWRPGELCDHIAAQLTQKEGQAFHGGLYAEIIVCMFTDEPVTSLTRLSNILHPSAGQAGKCMSFQ